MNSIGVVRRHHGPFAQILGDFVIARCRQREKGLPIDALDGQNMFWRAFFLGTARLSLGTECVSAYFLFYL